MNLQNIYSHSIGLPNKIYIGQGPTVTGQPLASGDFFKANYGLIKYRDSFFFQNMGTGQQIPPAFFDDSYKLDIQPTKDSLFFSFSFNNSGQIVIAEQNNAKASESSFIRLPPYTTTYEISATSPIILNTVNYNQPFNGVDISGTRFTTGELICLAQKSSDLVAYLGRDSFSVPYLLNTGILSGKTLLYGCFNRRELQNKTYHPFSILIFARTESGIDCFETKYQTNLAHHLFEEYNSESFFTGTVYGGWGHTNTAHNSCFSQCFKTTYNGYHVYTDFPNTGVFNEFSGIQYIVASNEIEISNEILQVKVLQN